GAFGEAASKGGDTRRVGAPRRQVLGLERHGGARGAGQRDARLALTRSAVLELLRRALRPLRGGLLLSREFLEQRLPRLGSKWDRFGGRRRPPESGEEVGDHARLHSGAGLGIDPSGPGMRWSV